MSKLFTRVSALDDNVNKMVTKLVTNFDITGEGTILGAGTSTSASTQSAPSTPAGPSVPPPEEQPRKAKTPQQHRPNKKQQLKHAMTVQSAHMITTDYVALSQPLVDGMLLNDRTEHKLKLIHSLGELQPMHTYTTEYGNVLERPSKYKAVLAGSIELEVTTDEADFDNAMGKLALAGEATASLPNTHMRMASYDAFSKQQVAGADGGANGSQQHVLSSAEVQAHLAEDSRYGERLREAEALQRIAALVKRLKEMEEWFTGVKAEAERERRMREQSTARLSIMHERVDLLSTQVTDLQRENRQLRQRVADLSAVYEGEHDSINGSLSAPSERGSVDVRSIQGFGSGSRRNLHSPARSQMSSRPLSSVRGGLGSLTSLATSGLA